MSKKTPAKKTPAKKAVTTKKTAPAKKAPAKKSAAPKKEPTKKVAAKKPVEKKPVAAKAPASVKKPTAEKKPAATPAEGGAVTAAPWYGITRIDQAKGTHLWFVRLPTLGKDGGMLRASFADGKHGGKDGALKAAQEFRDEKFKELPLHLQVRGSKVRKPSSRSAR